MGRTFVPDPRAKTSRSPHGIPGPLESDESLLRCPGRRVKPSPTNARGTSSAAPSSLPGWAGPRCRSLDCGLSYFLGLCSPPCDPSEERSRPARRTFEAFKYASSYVSRPTIRRPWLEIAGSSGVSASSSLSRRSTPRDRSLETPRGTADHPGSWVRWKRRLPSPACA